MINNTINNKGESVKKQTRIPTSCNSMMAYKKGGIATNPYSNVSIELNNTELGLYDLMKGAEFMGQYKMMDDIKGWFVKNNIKAYSILID